MSAQCLCFLFETSRAHFPPPTSPQSCLNMMDIEYFVQTLLFTIDVWSVNIAIGKYLRLCEGPQYVENTDQAINQDF